jgi:hypothetical protein
LNLKQAVVEDVIPLISKTRNLNNSYNIVVKINKNEIDEERPSEYTHLIPIYNVNQTADMFFTDYHHVKIPKNASWINRTVETKKKIHEVNTVTNYVFISFLNKVF